ncbi:Homocysteine S-methyltransferase [Irpex rosettiformis]|uniref:Homocysteine S-methyltransferase n=1 Tax=Irpex rosettiformis TaxID=378272 RepID=A0ACB8TSH7_9APHY|nr:Homocysteine S-methyltransferase [Irpex rosettiformis]
MPASSTNNNVEVLVLDGGFGTTLETLFLQDISGPLWSARLIDTDPNLVVEAHKAFLASGADIILTSTYQCSHSTFSRAGYTREDGERIKKKAVTLAKEARDQHLADQNQSPSKKEPKIALSLGSFGATLPGGEEFGGRYPPPFGPPALNKANTFAEDESDLEEDSIRALTEFYLERLRVYVPVWDAIDYVAFETVPLRREVRAIRRAMRVFLDELSPGLDSEGKQNDVKWWISTVWPEGLFPEVDKKGEHTISVKEVIAALLGEREGEARPWGVGVNCTFLEHVPKIVGEMEDSLGDFERGFRSLRKDESEKGDVLLPRPWLVVYPNGGDTYDGNTQTWITNEEANGEQWARKLWDVVSGVVERKAWSGVIVGGCCRTGPDEIGGLVRLISPKEAS